MTNKTKMSKKERKKLFPNMTDEDIAYLAMSGMNMFTKHQCHYGWGCILCHGLNGKIMTLIQENNKKVFSSVRN